jgi:cardiolipin synthase
MSSNRYKLLENGEEYFPAVFAAIAAAQNEIYVETFILFEDAVGLELQAALIAAAQRGVTIDVTVDGYGSPDLSAEFVEKLTAAGIRLHLFDPRPRLLGLRINIFRRMHRKIVSIDGITAFIGGINFSADHLLSFGKDAKQDYAVRIEGPLAQEIHRFAAQQAGPFARRPWWLIRQTVGVHPKEYNGAVNQRKHQEPTSGNAILVLRDNHEHRTDIEQQYRAAIRAASREIVIACAYFFPGYQLLRQLRRAAHRGVSVKLILQGAPDMPQVRSLSTMLYPSLLQSGVQIYEYCQRPLHAKVAVIDDEWSTIGSSNLDPLSLALNLEANVVIRDRELNQQLRDHLEPLLRQYCKQVDRSAMPRGTLWTALSNFFTYHCTRHFPRWVGWLPAHLPNLQSVAPDSSTAAKDNERSLRVVGDDFSN